MINEQIRDKEVRLIGSDGEQLGIMSAKEAMFKAQEAGLDLVKIAPQAKPPVNAFYKLLPETKMYIYHNCKNTSQFITCS